MLNKKYQSQSNVIASYDYTDIASGTGITNFYAGEVSISGSSISRILSNVQFYSNSISTEDYTGTDTDYTEKFDLDFDVLMNKNFVIEGKSNVNIPVRVGITGSSDGASMTAYVIVKLRKWDGVTETEIASNTTKLFYAENAVGADEETEIFDISAVYLDIPQTVFKVGEYLRLTCIGYAKRTQNGTYHLKLGYDPMNRSIDWDAAGSPSSLILQIPQKLDI